jgi:hypothetical protein
MALENNPGVDVKTTEETGHEPPLVGDVSPVDQVPVKNTPVAPRTVAEADQNRPLVGDVSPVDKIPVDNAPVVDEKEINTCTTNFRQSPNERAARIKERDDVMQNAIQTGQVPLDEKALYEKKKGRVGTVLLKKKSS